ncbi:ras-related and estrogen-regulated growth inhibitor-like [Octopus vulgaris]|uniref:Ras-related and estrogen-regulated growth inhibitor-like n=3 Tax=Octopus TaxID=6643 RepID=A0AA36FII1_OCTVU|nr:ras-related and estrogen-regulated growth inhibitor [Octopus bimaculoides]XP_029650571.1 ras-related and estrogen-regulated growth inhibitor [Octopus sinensis]CAI9740090.1 ras-related and estrogen-regulated growth inhibitor-like [Octopus vulgaris]|eukprot:XP_014773739.1 PREDICTED: ras-related and estrogen-regulated growth inhibitor-like [Octopus bimaculoides]
MNSSGTTIQEAGPVAGATLRPYLKRKKSSLGETKVAVVGAEGVGKSALSVRFLTRRFIGEYDQSSDTKYKHNAVVDGESVAFEIMDTRSLNQDNGARDDVIRWGDGFMLVYSVTSRTSFDIILDIRRKIEDVKKAAHVPVIVVGNKADMAHVRQVTHDEGRLLAIDFGCPFMEVSASEDVNKVLESFHILCREIIDFKRKSRTFLDRVFGLKKS